MSEPFYSEGLRFECTQCHACCRHDPGFVFLGKNEFVRLIDFLKTDKETFLRDFTRWVDTDKGQVLCLKEKKNFDCIFWNNGCTVYGARPVQCSTYPFWKNQVSSAQNWKWEGRFCPGINQGPLRSRQTIESALQEREKNPPLTPETLWEI